MNYFKAAEQVLLSVRALEQSIENLERREKRLVQPLVKGGILLGQEADDGACANGRHHQSHQGPPGVSLFVWGFCHANHLMESIYGAKEFDARQKLPTFRRLFSWNDCEKLPFGL